MEQNVSPQVFISYSWDSDDHKEKVNSFVQDLRSYGIHVIYDEDLKLGRRLPHFMEDSILKSDFVLFVCTPKYKERADCRVAGVGYESQIITGELVKTSNEEKFIPVLFEGTWETSLPNWAEGKLGIDLSSQEFYTVKFPQLASSLKNSVPSNYSIEDTSQYMEAKAFIKENSSDTSSFKEKILKFFRKLSNPNTFFGLLLVTVIGGIIVNILQPSISPPSPNSNNQVSDNSSIASNNAVLDNTLSNGTMPKSAPLPEGTEEKLSFIQELTIGSSKKWIDDKLGPPFAEKKLPIKDGRLLIPYDEDEKDSEILVSLYNISDVVVVQAYFDIFDNSCQAFFVTLRKDFLNIEIAMPKAYATIVSDKALGEFTFGEVGESPIYAYGFSGQGVARTFYGEEHYLGASGNYQNFYFAVLDYGMLNSLSDFVLFLSNIQHYIAPAINATEISMPKSLSSQRNKFYPNTYGISTLGRHLTFDLLADYWWFDSFSFRSES